MKVELIKRKHLVDNKVSYFIKINNEYVPGSATLNPAEANKMFALLKKGDTELDEVIETFNSESNDN